MTMTERTKTQEEVAIAGSFCKTNRVEKLRKAYTRGKNWTNPCTVPKKGW